MKKSLLVYTYSAKNAGDMAITLGALDYLTSKYDECICVSRYSVSQENYIESTKFINNRYSNVKNHPSPFHLDRSIGYFGIIKDYLIGLFKLLVFGNHLFATKIKDVDTVYFNGGNLLRCNKIADLIRLIALLKPLKVAINNNKRVVVLPHSTAETNLIGRFLLSRVLNKVDVLYAREPLSYNKFKANFPGCKVSLSTDLAFAINHGLKLNKRQRIVAITTRSQTMGDIGELNNQLKEKIKNSLIECVNHCISQGFKVKLVIQTKKDVEFTKLIYSHFNLNNNVSLYESYNVIDLINLYSSCTILIGMRLHSIILALSVGTPVIGYFKKEWGLKNPGLLTAYNQEFVFIDDKKQLLEQLKKFNFANYNKISKEIIKTKINLLNKIKF